MFFFSKFLYAEELLIGSAKLLENLTRHMKHDEEVPYKSMVF